MKKNTIAIYYGTSFDKDFYKEKIINGFDASLRVIVAKRFNHKLNITRPHTTEIFIHNDPIFSSTLSENVICKCERWLGIPFLFIFRCWYNWDISSESNKNKMEKYYEAAAKYVLFWIKFFTENKVDVFVTTLESTFPEIISMEVAKRLNVKIIILNAGRISNTFLLYDDRFLPLYWRRVTTTEKEKFTKFIRQRYRKRTEPEFSYLRLDVDKYGNFSPDKLLCKFIDFKKYVNNYHRCLKIDKLRTLSPIKLFLKIAIGLFRSFYASRHYTKFDFSKNNYVFFPLHFSDEAALSYQESFLDQFRLIRDISTCLPLDTWLVVKPHPHWRCMDVPIWKIRELKKIPRVVLVSHDTNVYELIQHSKGVLTINSTTGFEALAMDKPVITFGHDFYAVPCVAEIVYDMNDLPDAIARMVSGRVKPNEEKMRGFFSLYYKHLIFLNGEIGLFVKLTDDDGKVIAQTIKEYLDHSSSRKGGC